MTSSPGSPGRSSACTATRATIDKGHVDFIQFDCIKNGGLTEFQKVAAHAEAQGGALAPHHVPHFHAQIAAAYPHTAWVEAFDNAKQHVAWLDPFPGYPEVRNGHTDCHDQPGWGFELNEDFLRARGTLVHWRS